MQKYTFILSAKAGKGAPLSIKDKIYDFFKEKNLDKNLNIIITTHKHHVKDATRNFLKEDGEKYLYICGGDGSLNEVVNEVVNKDINIGLIPLGTANDFAKCFDYKNFSLDRTINPKIRKVDVIKLNNIYGINVISFGFDTFVLKRTYEIMKKFPFLGNKAFFLAALSGIINLKPNHLDISLNLKNGEIINISKDLLISAICNGRYYGSGFNPSPNGNISDGIMEFLAVDNLNRIEFLNLLPRYKKGSHLSHKKVKLYEISGGTISSSEKIYGNCDGEIFYDDKFKFEILKGAINLIDLENENSINNRSR